MATRPATIGKDRPFISISMKGSSWGMRTVFVCWMAFLIALCLAPVPIKMQLKTTGRLHDFGHVLAFLITSTLLLWRAKRVGTRLLLLAVAGGLAYATEYWEMVIYHNRLEWGDILIDTVGILLGFLLTLTTGADNLSPEVAGSSSGKLTERAIGR